MKQVIHICLFLSALVFSSFVLIPQDKKATKVRIETTHGVMVAVLYDDTPLHRDNFIKNIREGVYKDLLFHRVINEFMIQGGDPDSRNAQPGQVLGNGSLGYTIPAEFRPNHYHRKGVLAMARQGDDVNPKKESSSCQFYIVHGKVFEEKVLGMMEERVNQQTKNQIFNELLMKPENAALLKKAKDAVAAKDQAKLQEVVNTLNPAIEEEFAKRGKFAFSEEQKKAYTSLGGAPHLDGSYTAFGEVIEGLEVLDKIAAEKTDQYNRPATDIKMNITIIE